MFRSAEHHSPVGKALFEIKRFFGFILLPIRRCVLKSYYWTFHHKAYTNIYRSKPDYDLAHKRTNERNQGITDVFNNIKEKLPKNYTDFKKPKELVLYANNDYQIEKDNDSIVLTEMRTMELSGTLKLYPIGTKHTLIKFNNENEYDEFRSKLIIATNEHILNPPKNAIPGRMNLCLINEEYQNQLHIEIIDEYINLNKIDWAKEKYTKISELLDETTQNDIKSKLDSYKQDKKTHKNEVPQNDNITDSTSTQFNSQLKYNTYC